MADLEQSNTLYDPSNSSTDFSLLYSKMTTPPPHHESPNMGVHSFRYVITCFLAAT